MNARRVEVTFSEEDWAALNESRGFESRASFVKRHYKRALESALENRVGDLVGSGRAITPAVESREVGRGAEPEPRPVPAPTRTPLPAKDFEPTDSPPTFSKPTTAPRPQPVPSVKSGRDVLNAQRQERMNKQRKP